MNFIEQLPEVWQKKWQALGYEEPSVIQSRSYQPLMNKATVIGVSPTGSGKTVAYLLPLLLNVKKEQGSQLLIILPSQELAIQVAGITREWGSLLELNVQSVTGGANVKRQIERLKEKPEVIVGTPGRILELIKQKKIKAHLLETIVLDEVDQLIADTEVNLTQEILKTTQNNCQLVFYSATANVVAEKIPEMFRCEPLILDVTKEDQSSGHVIHGYIETPTRKRADILRRLAHVPDFKGIVFFNQLSEMGLVADRLAYEGIAVSTLASDQNKLERRLAIQSFEQGKVSLLLTTDVASRGLDFNDLYYVIQYDQATTKESYTHRSGRIGRMGNDGSVITLSNDRELRELKKLSKESNFFLQEVFLYGGQLHLEQPKLKKAEVVDKKVVQSTESTGSIEPTTEEAPVVRTVTEPKVRYKKEKTAKAKPEKVKVKKRKKDQKNKGARKKKKEEI